MASGGSGQTFTTEQTKLIVNNLPRTFTDEEFKNMFTHFGAVRSVNLCRDKSTHKMLGYGFVDYMKASDAARAIEDVNGLQLGKKKLRVAHPDPVSHNVKNATKVVVNKLPVKYDEDNIKTLFSKFGGRIIKVRLMRDSVTNKSQTLAFVFYETWSDAQRAVSGLNGFKPDDGKHPLQVKIQENHLAAKPKTASVGPYSQSRPHSQTGGTARFQQPSPYTPNPGSKTSTVFLYNIGEYISEHEIYNMFAQFGGLLKIDIARDPNTHLSKGYAFLSFETKGAAENAIFTMDGMFYRGRQLQVRYKHN